MPAHAVAARRRLSTQPQPRTDLATRTLPGAALRPTGAIPTSTRRGSVSRAVKHEKPTLSRKYVRRRPTLPHRHQCSTIGAERLSFRVRNGTGRFPLAMTAVTLTDPTEHHTPPQGARYRCYQADVLGVTQWTRTPHTPKSEWTSCRLISTSQLHALLRFHIWPINPVV